MFRVVFFCDDRRLADTLRALQGLSTGVPQATPVVNAEIENGKIRAVSNGSAVALFQEFLKKKKINEVNAGVAKKFLKTIGRSPASANYLLKQANKAGALRPLKAGSTRKNEGKVYAVQVLIPPPKRSKATAS